MSEHRDIEAAKRFFKKAINKSAAPEKISLDGHAATRTAVDQLQQEASLRPNVIIRTSQYLNNLIEQDHRRVKQRDYPMLGFNKFSNAAVTIDGIELAHKIKKGHLDPSRLRLEGEGTSFGKEFWQRKIDQNRAGAYFYYLVCTTTI